MAQPLISIRNLKKRFGAFEAVRQFDLDITEGEVVSLLGPSGCGKTTTLRMIAGLEEPTGGEITIHGRRIYSDIDGINLPPETRNLSMVFQQYALWPHMTVFENVAFGLRVKRTPKAQLFSRVETTLRRVQLWDRRDHNIGALSGGQQQRVALARALSIDPKVILFDEPLSNLDAKLREELRFEILHLQRELGFSAVFVTHDQEEAISLSSRIVVMNEGSIEQIDTPENIWARPKTRFVAEFAGTSNRIEARIARLDQSRLDAEIAPGLVLEDIAHDQRAGLEPGAGVTLYFKTSDIVLEKDAGGPTNQGLAGEVTLCSFHGETRFIEIAVGPLVVKARVVGTLSFVEGDKVRVIIDRGRISIF